MHSRAKTYRINRPASLLRTVLRANGAFSGLSGLCLAIGARPVASIIGLPWSWVLIAVGTALVGYAVSLFQAAQRPHVDRRAVTTFIGMDIAWVVGSVFLVITDWVPFTTAGTWTVVVVADVVATFAALQAFAVWRLRRQEVSRV